MQTVDFFLNELTIFKKVLFLIEISYETNTGKKLECNLIKGMIKSEDAYKFYAQLNAAEKQAFESQFKHVRKLVVESRLLVNYKGTVYH